MQWALYRWAGRHNRAAVALLITVLVVGVVAAVWIIATGRGGDSVVPPFWT